MCKPLATQAFGGVAAAIDFLNRTRNELRELRKVRVFEDKLHVIDINGDCFEITGIGYADAKIVTLLQHVNTNFNPKTIHDSTTLSHKEFKTGRRRAWAEDRVM